MCSFVVKIGLKLSACFGGKQQQQKSEETLP